ncbi:MAG: hypothetical protein A2Z16_05295 [Chloroflexi bacterium RBG_16_54_18]|nr:MAG: hypothetical protein A2Z16_05295 [Chloroflexi bacterium RBG_16_54_18]
MEIFFSQVFTLLTSETGSLAFHLVLAFSILGALQITFSHSRGEFNSVSLRLALGLGGLLILQMLLFVISGLGWQGLVDSGKLLPPLDRAVMLISTILIIWMWVSIKPTKLADVVMLVFLLLIATASVLGCIWWINQPEGLSFNYSALDLIAQVTQILFLLVGGFLLVLLRSAGWVTGICMLGIMLLGPIMHFAFQQIQGDYSGAVRLSLIAAYPFLLYLPQHIPALEIRKGESAYKEAPAAAASGEGGGSPDAHFLQSINQMILEIDPDQSARMVASFMVGLAGSDMCLLAKVIEEEQVVVITSGFDRVKRAYLEKMAIPIHKIPVFASSYRLGRMRKLKLTGSSPEMVYLTRAMNVQELGNVLLMPVLSQDGQPLAGLIFLNPYSEVDWTSDEQSKLHQYARILVYLLQRTEERLSFTEEIGESQTMLRLVQEQVQLNSIERQKLLDQLHVIQQETGMVLPIPTTLGENTTGGFTVEPRVSQTHALFDEPGRESKVEGDLRMALEEIIRLRADLAEVEGQLAAGTGNTSSVLPDLSKSDTIGSIAEDIRDSASSIAENNRVLLEGTSDLLDASQRKYLERINNAASRLRHLAGELILQSGMLTSAAITSMEALDLISLLGNVLLEMTPIVEEKNILLERDFPPEPLIIHSSAVILESIFSDLLKNAIESAGGGGKVGLSLKLERADGKQDFTLAQISDSGEGIDAQEQLLLFSPLMTESQIQTAESEKVNFAEIKMRIESLNGKIWVDSEPGKGTTFSLLLPTSAETTIEAPDKGTGP